MARTHGPDAVVHPECRALDGGGSCNCEELLPTDVDRSIEVQTRLEARNRTHRVMGHGPDRDDAEERSGGVAALDNRGERRDVGEIDIVERGFWKNSEQERCNAGLDFAGGEMLFPIKRDPSSNWARAAEAAK